MSGLNLLETGCLASLLLLSLVLPLMMSASASAGRDQRKLGLRTVWTGQTLIALAALVVLLSPAAALYATVFGALSCLGCAVMLRRQVRATS